MAKARTTSNGSIILRLRDHHEVVDTPIRRTHGFLNPANLISLFEATDLTANPRLPRLNQQVRDMWDAIEKEDKGKSFHYKNNGILVSASSCEPLDRGRFRISFDPAQSDEHPRGILNGGHTTFACMTSLIRQIADAEELTPPKFRVWEEFCQEIWPEWRDRVTTAIDGLKPFFVPIEILYPAEGKLEEFDSLIHEIADARNNNCELTEETKANYEGYYAELKAAMPDDTIRNAIEWRTNQPGARIKARDVVALAVIPLSTITKEIVEMQFDLKQCYNNASRCSSFFNAVYQEVSMQKDAQRVLRRDNHGKLVAAAISLTGALVELYDWLMVKFPEAYNQLGGRFGGLDGVSGKDGEGKYRTRYFDRVCDYRYSDGFFMPLLTASAVLVKRDGNELTWHEEPRSFFERHLNRIMQTYKPYISSVKNDGHTLGRDSDAYELASASLRNAIDLDQAGRR